MNPTPSDAAQHAASTFTYGEPLPRQYTDANTWKLAAIIQKAIDSETKSLRAQLAASRSLSIVSDDMDGGLDALEAIAKNAPRK